MCPDGTAILGKYLALEIMDARFLQALLSTFLFVQTGEICFAQFTRYGPGLR